jgi:7-cyano-7-deazaguanine synthase in queuosine biosynthesis
MNSECLLYTGGVDSYIAREYLIKNDHKIDLLYFDHGGRYCSQEIERIEATGVDVIISNNLNFEELETESAYIPNRNILMMTMANAMGYNKVWLGGSLSDRIGDNKSEVCYDLSTLLTNINDTYIEVNSPFYGCYKDDMVKWYVKEYPNDIANLLKDTFSCFHPDEKTTSHKAWIHGIETSYISEECMNCSACFRKCAVLNSGYTFIPFRNQEIIDSYENEFKNTIIETSRSIGTMDYIKRLKEYRDAETDQEGI